jgi:dTMP kinase
MAYLPDGTPLPGKLFIVEGIDGSGKSTQLDLLHKWLTSRGHVVVFTEWNSSPIVRQTTKKGKKSQALTPLSFHLIHAADFADRTERQILPALRAGAIVLADRYIYTAFGRDGARGMDPDYIRQVYSFAVQPTVAFYFRVPLKESLQRIMAGRPTLKYYEAGMDLGLDPDPYQSFRLFQERILDLYDEMTDEFGLRVIDATEPLVEQQQTVRQIVEPHLEGVLDAEHIAWGKVLMESQLHGRYLTEMGYRQ